MSIKRHYLSIIISFSLVLLLSLIMNLPSLAEGGTEQGVKATIAVKKFEYRVCTVQLWRVTFVNQVWMGKISFKDGNTDKAIASCPLIHEYLQEVGLEGWELVGCFSQRAGVNSNSGDDTTQTLFLKREK